MKTSFLFLFCFIFSFYLIAQSTLAERLGYAPTDKLLIIHADDLGVTHSENRASFKAINKGSVNSASIMAPTPWLMEVADYVKRNPDHDFGMHLTLTSEWKWLRWGPVSPISSVPSLVDENGFFYPDCQTLAQNAKPDELEIELIAQVEQAIRVGIQPTHLDSHMGCLLWSNPIFFSSYLKVARRYGIPAMISKNELEGIPGIKEYVQPEDIVVDRVLTANVPDWEAGMEQYYTKLLNDLEAGVSVLLIHCAYNDHESKGMSKDHPTWGADWRQQDTNFFLSQACQKILTEQGIKLVTWREIGALLKK